MRSWLQRVEGAVLVLGIMVVGSLALWVGVPLGWLWVAGRVQGLTGSIGAGLAVAAGGTIASVALLIRVLAWLSDQHRALRARRGLDDLGHLPLEAIMVCSATVAVVGFTAWFLLFAGTSPIPLNVSP